MKYYQLTVTQGASSIPQKPPHTSRLLLFSDIHLGCFPHWSQLFNKRLLGSFNHLLRRKHRLNVNAIDALANSLPQIQPDVILCSGDLTSTALPEEFDLALQKLTPFLHYTDCLYLPGNHDRYIDGEPEKSAVSRCISTINKKSYNLDAPCLSLVVKNIRFILLNIARPLNWFLSCGVITTRQQEEIQRLFLELPGDLPQILLCHFPVLYPGGKAPDRHHGIHDNGFLKQLLSQKNVDAFLCGHVHRPFCTLLPNGAPQLCAGSLTLHDSYSIIDIPQTEHL